MRRLEIIKATGCAALIGSSCAQLRARSRPQSRSSAARVPERPEAAQDTRSTGEATRATPEGAARRPEIIEATGCAQQKRGRSRFSMRFANRLQTVCNHAAERLRAIYAESSREMLREVV